MPRRLARRGLAGRRPTLARPRPRPIRALARGLRADGPARRSPRLTSPIWFAVSSNMAATATFCSSTPSADANCSKEWRSTRSPSSTRPAVTRERPSMPAPCDWPNRSPMERNNARLSSATSMAAAARPDHSRTAAVSMSIMPCAPLVASLTRIGQDRGGEVLGILVATLVVPDEAQQSLGPAETTAVVDRLEQLGRLARAVLRPRPLGPRRRRSTPGSAAPTPRRADRRARGTDRAPPRSTPRLRGSHRRRGASCRVGEAPRPSQLGRRGGGTVRPRRRTWRPRRRARPTSARPHRA